MNNRVKKLEAAAARRCCATEQRRYTLEGLRALHADPVQLGLLRRLRSLKSSRQLPAERLGEIPEGAALIARLKAHLATRGAAPCSDGLCH